MPLVREYFGQQVTTTECVALELGLHPQHRRDEVDLMHGRWFDYRSMLPAQATYLFAAQYRHEFIEAYKRTVDIRTADEARAFSPDDIFASSELVPMWLARREADRIGCKYDFYLHAAFARFEQRGWKRMPRPNQLYAEELVLDIQDAWKARCSEVMQFAEDPFFTAERYVGHPDQDDYYAWVIGQIKAREHKHIALSMVFRKKILPVELAGQAFGVELVNRALRFIGAD